MFILQTNLLILNTTYFNCKFQIPPPALALSEMYHEEVARSDLHLKKCVTWRFVTFFVFIDFHGVTFLLVTQVDTSVYLSLLNVKKGRMTFVSNWVTK